MAAPSKKRLAPDELNAALEQERLKRSRAEALDATLRLARGSKRAPLTGTDLLLLTEAEPRHRPVQRRLAAEAHRKEEDAARRLERDRASAQRREAKASERAVEKTEAQAKQGRLRAAARLLRTRALAVDVRAAARRPTTAATAPSSSCLEAVGAARATAKSRGRPKQTAQHHAEKAQQNKGLRQARAAKQAAANWRAAQGLGYLAALGQPTRGERCCRAEESTLEEDGRGATSRTYQGSGPLQNRRGYQQDLTFG